MSKFIKVIQVLVSSLMLFVSNNELALEKIYDNGTSKDLLLKTIGGEGRSVTIHCEKITKYKSRLEIGESDTISAFPSFILDFTGYFNKQNNGHLKIKFDINNSIHRYQFNDQEEKKNFLETILNYHEANKKEIQSTSTKDINIWQANCIEDNSGLCVKNFENNNKTKPHELCPFQIKIEKIPGIMSSSEENLLQTNVNGKTIEQFINSRIILV